jgi:hypothetical protein
MRCGQIKCRMIILPVLVIMLTAATACGFPSLNTREIKVIEKPDSPGIVVLKHGDDQQPLLADTEESIKNVIAKDAIKALGLLKNMDMQEFSKMIHPDKGVRFSPYGHVTMDTDLVFNAKQIANIQSDDKLYSWGIYDGSGAPIEFTFKDYYNKFLWDKDFTTATETGYNRIIGKGNTINNSFEVYPNSIIVEYHFTGFDPQYEGMDWESLKLVFEKKGTIWYIIGIIHDQWTI